jgi:hypothetical protein
LWGKLPDSIEAWVHSNKVTFIEDFIDNILMPCRFLLLFFIYPIFKNSYFLIWNSLRSLIINLTYLKIYLIVFRCDSKQLIFIFEFNFRREFNLLLQRYHIKQLLYSFLLVKPLLQFLQFLVLKFISYFYVGLIGII